MAIYRLLAVLPAAGFGGMVHAAEPLHDNLAAVKTIIADQATAWNRGGAEA